MDSMTFDVNITNPAGGGVSNPLTSDLDAGSNKVTNLATPTAGGDAANKAYVDALADSIDLYQDKGAIDCSTNPDYPAASAGHTYLVSVAGKIGGASGPDVEAGDIIKCNVDSTATGDHATVGANWTTLQLNIDPTDYVEIADTDASGFGFVLDEDNMSSDSATKIPTQQSTKAYADTKDSFGSVKEIRLDAGSMVATTTNGAESDTEEYATNDIMSDQFLFDGASSENVQVRWTPPSNRDLGTIKAKFKWDGATGASASDGVVRGIKGVAVGDDDAIDASFGTEITVADTLHAVGDEHITAATSAITIGGTPAASDTVVLNIARKVADGSDTMTEDAKLRGVIIQYSLSNSITAR